MKKHPQLFTQGTFFQTQSAEHAQFTIMVYDFRNLKH